MVKKTCFLRRRAREGLLFLLLAGAGCLGASSPAQAQFLVLDEASNAAEAELLGLDTAKWLKNLGYLGDILSGVSSLYSTTKEWLEKLFGTEGLVAAVENVGREMETRVDVRIAQGESIAGVQNVLLDRALATRAKYVKPPTQALCKNILVAQMGLTTQEFERNVARMAASAIETMYRGPKADGSGPQYGRDNYVDRCAAGFGSPLDYPAECVDSSVTGSNGKKLADADLDFCTISGDQILEIPEFEPKEINGTTYNFPNPQNPAQRFWVAGLYFCLNLAGPRPSPPYGDKMTTPEGMREKAQWNVCAARQNAILKPCLELLAHHTRPNSSMESIINHQKERCQEAKNAGLNIPEKFENCEKGLTPYQAGYIAQAVCKSPQYYVSQVLAGAKMGDLQAVNVDCALSWNMWKESEIRKQNKVITGIQGILELRDCWKAAERWGAR